MRETNTVDAFSPRCMLQLTSRYLCRAYAAFEATKTEATRAVNDDNCKDSQVRLEDDFKATFGCEEIGWGKAKSNGGRCSRFSVDLAAVVRAELGYGYVSPITLR